MFVNSDIVDANLQLIKYTNGIPAETENQYQTGLFESLGPGVMFGGPLILGTTLLGKSKPVSVWQWRQNSPKPDGSKLSWADAWHEYGLKKDLEKQETKYLKDSSSWWKSYKNKRMFSQIKGLEAGIPQFNKLPEAEAIKLEGKKLIKYNNSVIKNNYYSEVRKLIEEAKNQKLTGQALKAQLKKIHEAMAKADGKVNLAIQQGLIKPTGKLGKVSHWIKSKTGVYKIQKSLLKGPRGAKALRMAKVGVKGSLLFVAIEGASELKDVWDAYGKSRADGNRQFMKSGTKVAASVGGYALGAAAAGAAVGSVFPGVGTVVGAAVGLVGGLIGGWLAGKAAEKVTKKVLGESQTLAKTETDFAKDNQLKTEAQKISENPNEQKTLLAEVKQLAEQNGGFDDQATLDAYEKILNSRQAELGLGESGQEGAGSIVDTENSLMQPQSQYDDEKQKLLLGLSAISQFNKVA